MINCLRCEIARAKAKALALSLLGWTPNMIADKLSADYGERYYVEFTAGSVGWTQTMYRASKQHPFTPIKIKEFD